MRSYLIGHFIDVDGISSQSVLGRAMDREGIEPVHIDITYKNSIAALKQATPEKGETVRFFDFGYSPSLETPEAMSEWGRIAHEGELEIYDHHKGWPSESPIYRFARRVAVPTEGDCLDRRCTTEILQFFFGGRDNVPEMLAHVANKSDFGEESCYRSLEGYTKQLEQALRGANNNVTDLTPLDMIEWFKQLPSDFPLVSGELLLNSIFWPNHFAESAAQYPVAAAKAKKDLTELVGVGTRDDVKFIVGFADRILAMKDGNLTLAEHYPGSQVYACVYSDGSIIFNSNSRVDASVLGKAFNGGGRELWSGGFVPDEWLTTPKIEILERTREKIEQTLADIS